MSRRSPVREGGKKADVNRRNETCRKNTPENRSKSYGDLNSFICPVIARVPHSAQAWLGLADDEPPHTNIDFRINQAEDQVSA